jgi:hypothetical protein
MAESASDIILEFDRENDTIVEEVFTPGPHKVRPVYHNGPTKIPGAWRPLGQVWAGMSSAASHGHDAFDDFMAQTWPTWWANLPGAPNGQVPERKSACNQVREIHLLAPLP